MVMTIEGCPFSSPSAGLHRRSTARKRRTAAERTRSASERAAARAEARVETKAAAAEREAISAASWYDLRGILTTLLSPRNTDESGVAEKDSVQKWLNLIDSKKKEKAPSLSPKEAVEVLGISLLKILTNIGLFPQLNTDEYREVFKLYEAVDSTLTDYNNLAIDHPYRLAITEATKYLPIESTQSKLEEIRERLLTFGMCDQDRTEGLAILSGIRPAKKKLNLLKKESSTQKTGRIFPGVKFRIGPTVWRFNLLDIETYNPDILGPAYLSPFFPKTLETLSLEKDYPKGSARGTYLDMDVQADLKEELEDLKVTLEGLQVELEEELESKTDCLVLEPTSASSGIPRKVMKDFTLTIDSTEYSLKKGDVFLLGTKRRPFLNFSKKTGETRMGCPGMTFFPIIADLSKIMIAAIEPKRLL